jgi:hypothetical protein
LAISSKQHFNCHNKKPAVKRNKKKTAKLKTSMGQLNMASHSPGQNPVALSRNTTPKVTFIVRTDEKATYNKSHGKIL